MRDILLKYFNKNNILVDDDTIRRFLLYKDLLIEWNAKFNLTAITDEEGITVKHFIDSLSIRNAVMGRKNLADVGTGAGFPGLPLKISGFAGKLILMDSLKKRVNFLEMLIMELGLKKCHAVHIRAEDAGRGEFREAFETVTARAVANLPVLCEYCLPLVKNNGIFIAMKGPEAVFEIKASARAIEKLGGRHIKTENLILPGTNFERNLIYIEKIKKTPNIYPRKAGTPQKTPL